MRDTTEIPEAVWDDMAKAWDLAGELAATGRAVRFRRTPANGVVADVRGGGIDAGFALRDVALADVVDPERLWALVGVPLSR